MQNIGIEELETQMSSLLPLFEEVTTAWEARAEELDLALSEEADEETRKATLNEAAKEVLVALPDDLSDPVQTYFLGRVNSIRSALLGPLFDTYLS